MNNFPERFQVVWLASYPRSGNTFLRLLLKHVFGLNSYSYYQNEDRISHERDIKLLNIDSLPNNWKEGITDDPNYPYLFIKTHEFPCDSYKTIYIIRNGFFATNSWYIYLRKLSPQITLEEVICGACLFGSWAGHIQKWNPFHRKNTLILKFESLVKDYKKNVGILSNFLQISSKNAYPDNNILNFHSLHATYPDFFREGRTEGIPNWEPEAIEAFVNLQGEMMQRLGYHCPLPKKAWNKTILSIAHSAEKYALDHYSNLKQFGIYYKNSITKESSDEAVFFRLLDSRVQVKQIVLISNRNHLFLSLLKNIFKDAFFFILKPQTNCQNVIQSFKIETIYSTRKYIHLSHKKHNFLLNFIQFKFNKLSLFLLNKKLKKNRIFSTRFFNLIDHKINIDLLIVSSNGNEKFILENLENLLPRVSFIYTTIWLNGAFQLPEDHPQIFLSMLSKSNFTLHDFGAFYRNSDNLLIMKNLLFVNKMKKFQVK